MTEGPIESLNTRGVNAVIIGKQKIHQKNWALNPGGFASRTQEDILSAHKTDQSSPGKWFYFKTTLAQKDHGVGIKIIVLIAQS
ncbi:hypothetical protein D082_31260 [Synechocystis sp. PCC 6714]|nr:hypothetical protein D082_31260 [Synechocystis sp. PCC 6714]